MHACCIALAASIAPCAYSIELGDTKAIEKLRTAYIKAIESNDPSKVGILVSDDFVMLQPNAKGPDTYSRSAYVNYRKSLNKTLNIRVEPERVISCGEDTAFELGKEYSDLVSAGLEYSTLTRYAKVLTRDPEKGWRYSRAMMAIAADSYQAPPAPEDITNYGYATWTPKKQQGQAVKDAQEIRVLFDSTKLLADTKTTGFDKATILYHPDETTGSMWGFGTNWEITSFEDYKMADAMGRVYEPADDLRKIVEEVYVCGDSEAAYAFGQDVYSGVNKVTGQRWIGGGDFWYFFKKQDGAWKLGPFAASYDEHE